MKTNLAVLWTPTFFALVHPWLLLAQQTPPPPFPQQPPWNWPGHWHMWGGGWGFWWFFPLLMLFMIVICIASFFFGYRSSGGGHHHWGPPWHMMDRPGGPGRAWGDPTYSALQILNERFAKGEIQKEEYEEKKAVIRSSVQH